MAFESIDKIQNMLASDVFVYAKDKKKASGRALGTLVEIITYYALCAWNLRDTIAIERPVPEFAHPEIRHNVEFSLHPSLGSRRIAIRENALPLTTRKLLLNADKLDQVFAERKEEIVSTKRVLRNAAYIGSDEHSFYSANLAAMPTGMYEFTVTQLLNSPFAIFECKRVGVEEGNKKGPQTIEKAKQGAYVARTVSSLQKIRNLAGQVVGILDLGDSLKSGPYDQLLRAVIDGNDTKLLKDFILTVGVVSNHGNWFTAENHNKELKVLAHSYDWLLFLTDKGLCQFIERLLIEPVPALLPARNAFLASYNEDSKGNVFTKTKVDLDADIALKQYFANHSAEVESWFNIIAPRGQTLTHLRADLLALAGKNWKEIRK